MYEAAFIIACIVALFFSYRQGYDKGYYDSQERKKFNPWS